MQTGKDVLLDIINKALDIDTEEEVTEQQLDFYNTELNMILSDYNFPEDITKINEELLKKILSSIENPSERIAYQASLTYSVGLLNLKLGLNDLQKSKILTLKDLIAKTIQRNNFQKLRLKEKTGENHDEYRRIKTIIETDQIITSDDYDVIEAMVRDEVIIDVDSVIDKVMTFLNIFNATKLKELLEKKPKEQTKIPEFVELPKPVEDKKPDIEEVAARIINDKKPAPTNLIEAERTQKIKEIMSYLGYSFDDFDIKLQTKLKLLGIPNFNALEEFAKYLKEENKVLLQFLKPKNYAGLVYILSSTTKESIERVFQTFESKFNIKPDNVVFSKLVNTATTIFGEKGSQNFELNSEIFLEFNVSIKDIVDKSVGILCSNNDKFKNIINTFKKNNADIETMLKKCLILFSTTNHCNPAQLIEDNLIILGQYGFDLEALLTAEKPCFGILVSLDLASKLDQIIEVGLNEYIHVYPAYASQNFNALIIKRVYYAYKNGLEVWSSAKKSKNPYLSNNVTGTNAKSDAYPEEVVLASMPETTREIVQQYDSQIINDYRVITDEEIRELKEIYPILEVIDEGYRPAIYSDTKLLDIKRNTEFVFDTQVISRLKTFKAFKVLVEFNVPEKEALLYALTYNSILEEREYQFIKSVVEGIGVEKTDDRLSKTV